MHTRWIETEFANGIPPWSAGPTADARAAPSGQRVVVEVNGKRLEICSRPGAVRRRRRPPRPPAGRGRRAVRRRPDRPDAGHGVSVAVTDGATVAAGDLVLVLEAMKMEQPITAHRAGTVTGLDVTVGRR